MLSIDEALETVLARVPVRDRSTVEEVGLLDAVGRVLAEPIVSDLDLPPFARATMDGFAVRSAEAHDGAELRVIGESAAGRPFAGEVGSGEAARIFTGAPLPAGADAVIPVEVTQVEGGRVRLLEGLRPGQNVAQRAEQMRAGAIALEAGAALSAGDVALLASVGAARVCVRRRPTVAILATGTELTAVDERPAAGQIRESNAAMLAALVALAGAEPVLLGRVGDDRDAIAALARRGLEQDVLLLTGGSSVGDYDFTPEVLSTCGVEVHFDRVSVKPGKPTIFGTRGRNVAFGLPGNPISCFVVFHLFVRPALLRCAGLERARPPRLDAVTETSVRRSSNRDQVLPASLSVHEGELRARFRGWRGSGDVTCLRHADALLFVPAGDGELAAGSKAQVTPIDGGRCGDVALGTA